MPTSALPRISVRADVGIGPYGRSPTNPDLHIANNCQLFIGT